MIQRGNLFIVCLWFVIVVITGCTDMTVSSYPDLLAQSFRDKNLSYILRIDREEPGSVDSIIFDSRGNIIRTVEPGSIKRFEYNDSNFITRKWVRDDSPVNYAILYRQDSDHLRQDWFSIQSRKWNYSNDKLGECYKTVYFKRGKTGFIEEEVDSLAGDQEIYTYFGNGLLKEKTIFDLGSGHERYKWIYFYDKQERIQFIGLKLPDGSLVESYYFSNGLLDSSRTMRGHVYEYEYFYR